MWEKLTVTWLITDIQQQIVAAELSIMRRIFFSLALPLFWASASSAQVASPLELVRGLRGAGLTDLALERIQELKAKPAGLTADEQKILGLEVARTRIEQANQETEDGKRVALLAQAKSEFEAFTKANPTHPLAAQAQMEIARLISINAKGLLSKGRRLESKEARALEFSKVRPEFDKAIAQYTGAVTTIENQLKKLDPKDANAIELARSLQQALLDSAILRYEKSKTFVGEGEGAKQSEEILKAQKAFESIANKYTGTPSGYLASVWQTQCDYEILDPAKASKSITDFIIANRSNRDAADAVRQAQYFKIEHIDRAETKNPLNQKLLVELEATEWLKRYPEYRNSREGLRVRFLYLGLAKQDRAKSGVKYDAKTGRASSITSESRVLLEAANKIYGEIAESDNEYSERASTYRLKNMVALLDAAGAGKETPVTAIRTLEQGYLAAQVQQARIYQMKEKPEASPKMNLDDPKDAPKGKEPAPKGKEPAPKGKDPAPKVEAKPFDPKAPVELTEKERVKLAIAYLERGLSMVTAKDSPRDILNAQLLLALFLREEDRYIEAAVLCEGLARNNPKMSRAAFAAQIGVDSYNSALAKLKGSENKSDDSVNADLTRLKGLAEFADKNWPTEPPTDGVRQSLAFYQQQEKNFEASWDTLNRVSNTYQNIYQVRWAQGLAMFNLVNPTTANPKQYREELQKNITTHSARWVQTINVLEALAEPPPSVDPAKGAFYVYAKTLLAQLYFMGSDYNKCEAVVKAATTSIGKITTFDPAKRAELISEARVQYYRSLSGRAAEFIKAKEFAKVGETLEKDIAEISKELTAAPPESPSGAFIRMQGAQRNLLISTMISFVQDKKVDKASELLSVLQKGGKPEDTVAVMRQLVLSIRVQIDGLKKEAKTDEAKELSDSFASFLDKLATEPAKLPNSTILFLGDSYGSIDQHAKGIALLEAGLAKPFTNTGKTPAEIEEQDKANTAFRRNSQFALARSLRLAAGEENFKKATALMREIVGDPIAAKAPPRGWGYSNIAMRKEYIYLLEDQKLWNSAINNWVRLAKEFVPSIPPVPKEGDKDGLQKSQKRQLFFDLNYEAQRASAKAYASIDPMKFKGGKEAIDAKLGDIGQKYFDLLNSNKDVSQETREKIMAVVGEYPPIKKKFDELANKKD